MTDIAEDPYFYDRLAHTLKKAIEAAAEAEQLLSEGNTQGATAKLARAGGLIEGAHDQVRRVKIIPGEGVPNYEEEESLIDKAKRAASKYIP